MHTHIRMSLILFFLSSNIQSAHRHTQRSDLSNAYILGFSCGFPLPVIGVTYSIHKLCTLDPNAYIIPDQPEQRMAATIRAHNANWKKTFYMAMLCSSTMSTALLFREMNEYINTQEDS